MFTSSSLNISGVAQDEGDESEDELEDEVPWRSPSEKIAYVLPMYELREFCEILRLYEYIYTEKGFESFKSHFENGARERKKKKREVLSNIPF